MTQPVLQHQSNSAVAVLFIAFELSLKKWKLIFTVDGDRMREVTVDGGDVAEVVKEIDLAKSRFRLEANTKVFSCYEAGRDGFWLHRQLVDLGVRNAVIDPSSILVDRRARRAKTDRLDAHSLAQLLVKRWRHGDKSVWREVHVPSPDTEDRRRVQREVERLVKECTAHTSRIRSLFILHGIRELKRSEFKTAAAKLPRFACAEVLREVERLECVERQLKALRGTRDSDVAAGMDKVAVQSQALARFKGVAEETSSVLSREFYWRDFANRRQVGSCAGLTPTPYASGSLEREQGISKAGNRRVRAVAAELAWNWLRFQPDSELSKWFHRRFGSGGKRNKRVGIVALARKLLVAFWRYLERGEIPAGAVLKPA